MRQTIAIIALIAPLAAGLGWWAGRSSSSSPSPSPTPAPTTNPSPPAPAPATRRTAAGLVCASLGAPARDDDPSCEAAELRARWCEGQLDQCTGQRKAVRQPWPADDTVESPEAWTDAVEHALAECELGAELELVECTEYPCVAALRPADPTLDEAGREREMKRLMTAARACAPLRSSFGVEGPEHDEALDVYRLDARCGARREPFFVLTAVAPKGPAWELLSQEHRDEIEERDLFRWMYRRGDDVSGLWPCE